MKGPPLGPGGEDITWPHQVAPRGQNTPSTRQVKPQTSNLLPPLLTLRSVRREIAPPQRSLTPRGGDWPGWPNRSWLLGWT